MNGNLAIITPQIGTVSETFVRRHVQDICPNKTVAIVRHSSHAFDGSWTVSFPILYLDKWENTMMFRALARFGVPKERIQAKIIERFLHRHKVSTVLGEYLNHFLEFAPILDRLSIPYVVQGHGIDLSAALRTTGSPAKYLALSNAQAILTRCEFHRQRLIKIGLPESKIYVNPGGVDLPGLPERRETQHPVRFLSVGRMVPKKGPIYLLEAFRIAASKNQNIQLTYAGGGELEPAVKQFVKATNLSQRIHLTGMISENEKNRLLRESDVFIQHSVVDPETGDEEGLPAAIQEAMANGLAVISTFHSGIPELVINGKSGYLVNEFDCESMAGAILRLASNSLDVFQMGIANRNIIASAHTWGHERSRIMEHLGISD